MIDICHFFLYSGQVCEQSVNETYQKEATFLKHNTYVKNEKEYPIGYWGQHLKKEMLGSKDAVLEYSAFERKRKFAFILRSISLASIVSAYSLDDQDLQFRLVLGGLGLSIVSIPISISGSNNVHKAIWLRNGGAILE